MRLAHWFVFFAMSFGVTVGCGGNESATVSEGDPPPTAAVQESPTTSSTTSAAVSSTAEIDDVQIPCRRFEPADDILLDAAQQFPGPKELPPDTWLCAQTAIDTPGLTCFEELSRSYAADHDVDPDRATLYCEPIDEFEPPVIEGRAREYTFDEDWLRTLQFMESLGSDRARDLYFTSTYSISVYEPADGAGWVSFRIMPSRSTVGAAAVTAAYDPTTPDASEVILAVVGNPVGDGTLEFFTIADGQQPRPTTLGDIERLGELIKTWYSKRILGPTTEVDVSGFPNGVPAGVPLFSDPDAEAPSGSSGELVAACPPRPETSTTVDDGSVTIESGVAYIVVDGEIVLCR